MINKDKASRSSLGTEDDVSTGNEALNMLKEIFENINRWLQFAEAKHGALIGINGLFLFKSVDYIFGLLEECFNIMADDSCIFLGNTNIIKIIFSEYRCMQG